MLWNCPTLVTVQSACQQNDGKQGDSPNTLLRRFHTRFPQVLLRTVMPPPTVPPDLKIRRRRVDKLEERRCGKDGVTVSETTSVDIVSGRVRLQDRDPEERLPLLQRAGGWPFQVLHCRARHIEICTDSKVWVARRKKDTLAYFLCSGAHCPPHRSTAVRIHPRVHSRVH